MANFVAYALDKPDREKTRLEQRPAHRARLRDHDHPVAVKVGGPLLDGNGTMIGSLLILEAGSATAADFVAADPYVLAGVYASVAIHPFNRDLGNLTIGGAING
jgi:uncharacterized protein YciI